jgi:hypothetical protein
MAAPEAATHRARLCGRKKMNGSPTLAPRGIAAQLNDRRAVRAGGDRVKPGHDNDLF